VDNGSGLNFTVGIDRCMDFTKLSYKGTNLSFISPVGVVSPEYYSDKGIDFLRSFTAGFLTTCGIESSGSPSEDYPLHGRIGNTPAENVSVDVDESGEPTVTLKGSMREARLFAQNLRLTRETTCTYGKNVINFTDTVENLGIRESTFLMLYHFNMGYPLLSEDACYVIPYLSCKPRDEHAAEAMDSWDVVDAPINGFVEMCFLMELAKDENGRSFACIYNNKLDIGVVLRFDADILDHFTLWKQVGEQEYVVGLEPGVAYPDGRAAAIEDGSAQYIAPGEKKVMKFAIEIIEGKEALEKIKAEASSLTGR
ncbi:MAG: aldose 1-epimerase family protein, partial [Oscillospiraceae bacterium]|nr:aldose 1-epimerase family protein [Oscillospiraceae bacterium]